MDVKGKRKSGRSRANSASKANYADTPVQWFNPKPNAQDVKRLENDDYNLPDAVVQLVRELSANERISVKHDNESARWIAILFVDNGDSTGKLNALSVRAGIAIDALGLLAFMHLDKFAAGWFDEVPDMEGRFG